MAADKHCERAVRPRRAGGEVLAAYGRGQSVLRKGFPSGGPRAAGTKGQVRPAARAVVGHGGAGNGGRERVFVLEKRREGPFRSDRQTRIRLFRLLDMKLSRKTSVVKCGSGPADGNGHNRNGHDPLPARCTSNLWRWCVGAWLPSSFDGAVNALYAARPPPPIPTRPNGPPPLVPGAMDGEKTASRGVAEERRKPRAAPGDPAVGAAASGLAVITVHPRLTTPGERLAPTGRAFPRSAAEIRGSADAPHDAPALRSGVPSAARCRGPTTVTSSRPSRAGRSTGGTTSKPGRLRDQRRSRRRLDREGGRTRERPVTFDSFRPQHAP